MRTYLLNEILIKGFPGVGRYSEASVSNSSADCVTILFNFFLKIPAIYLLLKLLQVGFYIRQ